MEGKSYQGQLRRWGRKLRDVGRGKLVEKSGLVVHRCPGVASLVVRGLQVGAQPADEEILQQPPHRVPRVSFPATTSQIGRSACDRAGHAPIAIQE